MSLFYHTVLWDLDGTVFESGEGILPDGAGNDGSFRLAGTGAGAAAPLCGAAVARKL